MKQPAVPQLSPVQEISILIVFILLLCLKGVTLWRAAHGKQKNWFIALFIVFTIGFVSPIFFILSPILDLIFLFRYAKERVTLSDLTKQRSLSLPFTLPKRKK